MVRAPRWCGELDSCAALPFTPCRTHTAHNILCTEHSGQRQMCCVRCVKSVTPTEHMTVASHLPPALRAEVHAHATNTHIHGRATHSVFPPRRSLPRGSAVDREPAGRRLSRLPRPHVLTSQYTSHTHNTQAQVALSRRMHARTTKAASER